MNPSSALTLLKSLQTALTAEIANARHERVLLRTLDSKALLERSTRRQHFNDTTASLERQLAAELARAAATLGLPEVTIAAFNDPALSAALSELRALAAALGELDVLNHHLAERTLTMVKGYTNALGRKPAAYDRMGRTGT